MIFRRNGRQDAHMSDHGVEVPETDSVSGEQEVSREDAREDAREDGIPPRREEPTLHDPQMFSARVNRDDESDVRDLMADTSAERRVRETKFAAHKATETEHEALRARERILVVFAMIVVLLLIAFGAINILQQNSQQRQVRNLLKVTQFQILCLENHTDRLAEHLGGQPVIPLIPECPNDPKGFNKIIPNLVPKSSSSSG